MRKMFVKNILDGVEKQKIYTEPPKIDDIAVKILLINGDILPICFITCEDEKYLNIVELDGIGEKVNILAKDCIARITVLYADDIAKKEEKKEEIKDKMII